MPLPELRHVHTGLYYKQQVLFSARLVDAAPSRELAQLKWLHKCSMLKKGLANTKLLKSSWLRMQIISIQENVGPSTIKLPIVGLYNIIGVSEKGQRFVLDPKIQAQNFPQKT